MAKRTSRRSTSPLPRRAELPPKPKANVDLGAMIDLWTVRGGGEPVSKACAPEPAKPTEEQRTDPIEDARLPPERDAPAMIETPALDTVLDAVTPAPEPVDPLRVGVDAAGLLERTGVPCVRKCGDVGVYPTGDGYAICAICQVPKTPTIGWMRSRVRRLGMNVVGLTVGELAAILFEKEKLTFGETEGESEPLFGRG